MLVLVQEPELAQEPEPVPELVVVLPAVVSLSVPVPLPLPLPLLLPVFLRVVLSYSQCLAVADLRRNWCFRRPHRMR